MAAAKAQRQATAAPASPQNQANQQQLAAIKAQRQAAAAQRKVGCVM